MQHKANQQRIQRSWTELWQHRNPALRSQSAAKDYVVTHGLPSGWAGFATGRTLDLGQVALAQQDQAGRAF